MSLFRSEEHLNQWLALTQHARGAALTLEQTWWLARAWYTDPRAPDWRPRTRAESQQVLADAGLTDPFWELPQ